MPRCSCNSFAGGLLGGFLCAIPFPALAEPDIRFSVIYSGLAVANATLTARENGASYALAARVEPTGLARIFARLRFQMQAEGRVTDAGVHPHRYAEDVDTGRRASLVEIDFSTTPARILRQSPPPGPEAVPPADAQGAIDPLTALWRAAGGGGARPCGTTLQVYDGARRSEISLGEGQGTEATLSCSGRYTRLAGFPEEYMAERQSFPFTARYTQSDGDWVLTELSATSLFGPIRIVRTD